MIVFNWKNLLPLVFTVAVLSAVVWWTQTHPAPPSSQPESPDSVVWRMIEACREGDIESYLSCFSDNWRKRLEQVAKELGEEKLRTNLRQMVAPIKNIAVWAPEQSPLGDWGVTVEFVFADRKERQTFSVKKIGGEWKIVDIETTQPVPVLIPYGTPVKGL